MARGSRQIVVQFLGDTKDFDRATRQVEGSTSRLGKNFKRVGLIAGAGLAAGTVVAGKALVDMGKAAAEDQKSTELLAQALRNNANATKGQIKQTEDWIASQGKALGITDDQLRPALSNLVRATGDVTKAQKLASLAMDVSAGTGKDLGAVSLALAKAQKGNTTGLVRLGIAVKNADGSTKSFAQVQDELAKKFKGSSAVAANTFEGRMSRLKLQFDEAKESLGYKLLPVAEKFAGWVLKDGIPAVAKFSDWLKKKLGPIVEDIADLIRKNMPQIKKTFKDGFESVRSIVQSVTEIVTVLWKRFGGVLTSFTQGTMKNLLSNIGGTLKVISGIFKTISAVMRGDWSGAWAGIKQIAAGAMQVLKAVIGQGMNVIKTVVGLAWQGIKGIVGNGAEALVDSVRGIPGRLKALGTYFKAAGRHLIQSLVNGLKNAGGLVSDISGNVWTAVKKLLNSAITSINNALEFKISLPGPDIHVNPPNIPKLAQGGIVKARPGGTLALIGEGGRDEAVIPLGRGARGGLPVQRHVIELRLNGKTIREILLNDKNTRGVSLGLT